MRKQKDDIIKDLSPREHLIKRTNLTFGRETSSEESPFSSQKSVAVREIIDNSTGHLMKLDGGGRIDVTFHKDNSITVQDDGLGIPVVKTKTYDGKEVTSLYLATGVLQAGGNLGEEAEQQVTTSQNGLGGSATNFMSKRYSIEVYRKNEKGKPTIYSLEYKDGTPGYWDKPEGTDGKFEELTDLTYLKTRKDDRSAEEKKNFPTGTKIRFWLDDTLFSSRYPVDIDDLIDRLRGPASLIKGLEINVLNEHRVLEDGSYQTEHFQFDDGIVQLVELQQKNEMTDVIKFHTTTEYVEYTPSGEITRPLVCDVAFSWGNHFDYEVESYVNTIRTRIGGVHEEAFENALVSAFNEKLRSIRGLLPKSVIDPQFQDYKEGMAVVISVEVIKPEFTGQAKEELGGKELQKALTKALTKDFSDWVNAPKNIDTVKKVGEKIVQATKVRQKEKETRDLKRKKNSINNSSTLPVKLVDCEITHQPESELYIVEGDSALGALKSVRNSKFQALLPIRGKLINAQCSKMKDILANKEVQDIIKSLDAGVGEDFDLEKARYQRIFIACDADVDGDNIACLIYALFYNLFPEVVRKGAIYRILTPLFVVTCGGKRYYAYNDREMEILKAKLKGKKYTTMRAKGLGETGADVLEETGFNPETRKITQIVIGNQQVADNMMETALGDDSKIRREWLEDNPIEVVEE